MSRSGYGDDYEYLDLYRQAVDRAMNGKRGQAFLRELTEAMDAMEHRLLVTGELITVGGDVCTIGVVCKARGVDVSKIDYYDAASVGNAVGIARSMAAEIEFMNDEWEPAGGETPEQRWTRMRQWVSESIVEYKQDAAGHPPG